MAVRGGHEARCGHAGEMRKRVDVTPINTDAEVDALTMTWLDGTERRAGTDSGALADADFLQRAHRDEDAFPDLDSDPAQSGDPAGEPHGTGG